MNKRLRTHLKRHQRGVGQGAHALVHSQLSQDAKRVVFALNHNLGTTNTLVWLAWSHGYSSPVPNDPAIIRAGQIYLLRAVEEIVAAFTLTT